jgi:hypothetical protein
VVDGGLFAHMPLLHPFRCVCHSNPPELLFADFQGAAVAIAYLFLDDKNEAAKMAKLAFVLVRS